MELDITTNVARLNSQLDRYAEVSKKTMQETIEKQSGKFAWFLREELRKIVPTKGSIRDKGIALLKAGRGVRVRPSILAKTMLKNGVAQDIKTRKFVFGNTKKETKYGVKGKRKLNVMALAVKAELNIRERGRGFLSQSSRFPGSIPPGSKASKSRYGGVLSTAKHTSDTAARRSSVAFSWGKTGKMSVAAAQGITTTKGSAAVRTAMDRVSEDIELYLKRKVQEKLNEAGLQSS